MTRPSPAQLGMVVVVVGGYTKTSLFDTSRGAEERQWARSTRMVKNGSAKNGGEEEEVHK